MVVPFLAGAVAVVGAVGGGIVSLVQAIGSHPVLAYFLVLAFLILDGGISYAFNIQGIFGVLFSFVFQQLNFPLVVYSWQLLIAFAILPLVMFSLNHS